MSSPARGPAFRLLSSLLGIGLTLQVIGFFIAVLQVPRYDFSVMMEHRGSLAGLAVGLLVFGLGGVLSLIGVVGFGVLLGLRAHAEEKAPSVADRATPPETTKPGS